MLRRDRRRPQRRPRRRRRPCRRCRRMALERGRGVLEAVAGDGDDHGLPGVALPAASSLQQPGDAGGRGGLDEDAVAPGQLGLRGEDLRVGHRGEPALGLLGRHLGQVPGRGVADADRGGLGLRVGERLTGHQRCGALGLEAAHHGAPGGAAEVGVLLVAEPVGRDVAGVADRQQVVVGGVAEEVADLEGRGLLALQPDRVDRVDQRDRVVAGQAAGDVEAVVEVAADHDDLRAVHDGLGHLAGGDLALGDQHERLEAGLGGVGRHRGRGVAGRGADHGLGTLVPGAPRSPRSCRGP